MTRRASTVQPKKMSAHGPAARALTLGIIASAVLGVYASGLGYPHPTSLYPIQTVDMVMQNIGVALLALELVFAYSLKYVQQGVYWFFWLQLKRTHLDERQKTVRQRIFERSYAYSLIIMLFTVSSVTGMSSYATEVRNSLIARIIFAVGVILISLPSILAASQKDS